MVIIDICKSKNVIQTFRNNFANHSPRHFLTLCKLLGIKTVQTPYLNVGKIEIDTRGKTISESILATGQYQFQIMQAVADKLVSPLPQFVNIGANIGTTILNAWSIGFTNFVAVEPVIFNYNLLLKNLATHNISSKNLNVACGQELGSAMINLHPSSGGRHSLKDQFRGGQNQEVSVIKLDSLQIKTPFFLWVDTEGFELEVLKGGLETIRSLCLGACVEVSPNISGPGAACEVLELLNEVFSTHYDVLGRPYDLSALKNKIQCNELSQCDVLSFRPQNFNKIIDDLP